MIHAQTLPPGRIWQCKHPPSSLPWWASGDGEPDMTIKRRELLALASAAPLLGSARLGTAAGGNDREAIRGLPDRDSFQLGDRTYLDAGSQHPISRRARAAVDRYLSGRMLDPRAGHPQVDSRSPLEKFARLVNVDADEVTYVQSTTAGEQMVLRALGLPDRSCHVVTDTLHFFGSLPMYANMERQGMPVSWVRPRDGRIELDDVRDALRDNTRLVALSLVSTVNGFQQDLKAVCDLAHARGAYVYADIIHAAGCVPVDLHASGVDFAACASYKWLMGDFGLGFLYVRDPVRKSLPRTNYGYYGISEFRSHIYPLDPPGEQVVDYAFADSASGAFALGTRSHSTIAILDSALDYILETGVDRIQSHAQRLLTPLKHELERLGYELLTPPGTRTPMVTCVLADARERLGDRLEAASVKLTLSRNRFRASVSVFNDENDIDRLVSALGRA